MKTHIYKGAIIFILGYLLLVFASMGVKLLGQEVPVSVTVFVQSFICLVLTLPFIFSYGIRHLHTTRPLLHLARDFGGLAWFIIFFLSLKTLPLANATLLSNTVPLWMPFVLFIWLRVKMNKDLWWGIIVGFIGIILILRPEGNDFLNIGTFWALASGIIAAFTLLAIRELGKTEAKTRILFYYFLIMTLATLPFASKHWLKLSMQQWIILCLIGIFVWLEQFLLTLSFKYAKASSLAPLVYVNVVFAAILDWLIWKHVPDVLTFAGILLVITGGIITLLKERKNEKLMKKIVLSSPA